PFGFRPYGAGKPGAGGIAPTLRGLGLAALGQTVDYRLEHGLGAAPGLLVLGLRRATVPVLGGTLLVDPLAHQWFVLAGPTWVPAAGWVSLPTTFPAVPALIGTGIFAQGFVFDAAATFGLAMSDGLEIWIG
ncbi:MAG: hypothetical protein KDC98_10865, partial [Planctomycetes bacterium]|nr:hypothetical protein [Planctomycetota bacterium]